MQGLDLGRREESIRDLEQTTAAVASLHVDADLTVGCDGVHSVVRRSLVPGEGPPKWNGITMWRGTTVGEPFLDGRTMIMAGHTRQKFVAYPIAQLDGGRQLLNFVAELRFDRTDLAEREDWTCPGSLEDVLPAFETWDFGN